MKFCTLLIPLLLVTASFAQPAKNTDLLRNATFSVVGRGTEDQKVAKNLLAAADQYRDQISLDLFGEKLPPSVGRASIGYEFREDRDASRIWHLDSVSMIYLDGRDEAELLGLLKHEVAHLVLRTWFPKPKVLPHWIAEGIAGRYHDPERRRIIDSTLAWYRKTGNIPSARYVREVCGLEQFHPSTRAEYAIAFSLVAYIRGRGDSRTFAQFLKDSRRSASDALEWNYGKDLDEIILAWRNDFPRILNDNEVPVISGRPDGRRPVTRIPVTEPDVPVRSSGFDRESFNRERSSLKSEIQELSRQGQAEIDELKRTLESLKKFRRELESQQKELKSLGPPTTTRATTTRATVRPAARVCRCGTNCGCRPGYECGCLTEGICRCGNGGNCSPKTRSSSSGGVSPVASQGQVYYEVQTVPAAQYSVQQAAPIYYSEPVYSSPTYSTPSYSSPVYSGSSFGSGFSGGFSGFSSAGCGPAG